VVQPAHTALSWACCAPPPPRALRSVVGLPHFIISDGAVFHPTVVACPAIFFATNPCTRLWLRLRSRLRQAWHRRQSSHTVAGTCVTHSLHFPAAFWHHSRSIVVHLSTDGINNAGRRGALHGCLLRYRSSFCVLAKVSSLLASRQEKHRQDILKAKAHHLHPLIASHVASSSAVQPDLARAVLLTKPSCPLPLDQSRACSAANLRRLLIVASARLGFVSLSPPPGLLVLALTIVVGGPRAPDTSDGTTASMLLPCSGTASQPARRMARSAALRNMISIVYVCSIQLQIKVHSRSLKQLPSKTARNGRRERLSVQTDGVERSLSSLLGRIAHRTAPFVRSAPGEVRNEAAT